MPLTAEQETQAQSEAAAQAAAEAAEAEKVATAEAEEAAEVVAKAEKEKKLLSLESQEAVNARIAELVADKKEKQRALDEANERIKALEEKNTAPAKKQWTIPELNAIIADPDQKDIHEAAREEKYKIIAREEYAAEKKKDQDVFLQSQVQQEIRASVDRAHKEFPEFFDKQGETLLEIREIAERIFEENELDGRPNGNYLAYKLAKAEIDSKKVGENKGLKKKVDKLNAQDELSLPKGKVSTLSRNAQLDKLLDAARGTAKDSPEWNAYRKFSAENPDPKEVEKQEQRKKLFSVT